MMTLAFWTVQLALIGALMVIAYPLPGVPVVRKVAYWAAILLVPAMAAALIFPISTLTAFKVLLVFLAVVFLGTPGRLRITPIFAAHAAMLAYFVGIALIQPSWELNRIVVLDLLYAGEVLIAVPVLVAFVTSSGLARRFVRDSGLALVAVGLAGAVVGLVKFYLLTGGVQIAWLQPEEVAYPLGTALQTDYNLFSLGLLAALSAALWLRSDPDVSGRWRLICVMAIPLMALAAAFSTSRRGMILLVPLLLLQLLSGSRSGAVAPRRQLLVPLATVGIIALVFIGIAVESGNPVLVLIQTLFDVQAATARVLEITGAGDLVSSRAPLIELAWVEWSTAYSPLQMIFGRGFSYLREMAGPSGGLVYPHNLVLSALLHGGVVLAATMVYLLYRAARTIWTCRTEFSFLMPTFLLAVVFGVTSSNSIYSTELLYFLTVLAVHPDVVGWSPGRAQAGVEAQPSGGAASGAPA